MRRACLASILVLAVFAWAGPGTAQATTTFGANLARPANSTATCVTAQVFPVYFTNCSAESTNLTTGESGFPPGGEGVVSVVRVKVGPTTGPMQIVVEEALRKDNPAEPGRPTYACCKAVALSKVFTPAANAITAVPVDFRVKQSLTPEPSGFYVDQHLALSVLDPNVPIPASLDPQASVGLWYPAWQLNEERVGSYGQSGATVLFNADWDPVGTGTGGGGGAATVPVRFPARTANVRGNRALLPLICQLTTACDGQLLLQNRQTTGAAARFLGDFAPAARKKATLTYAKTGFSVPAGHRKRLKAKLTKAGERALAKRGRLQVWANVKIRGVAAVAPVKVTLKRRSSR